MPDSADSINSYQLPAAAGPAVTTLTAEQHRQINLLRDFRSQIATLGVCWVVFGTIALGAGTYAGAVALSGVERVLPRSTIEFLVTLHALGLVWIVLGILVYRRQLWALYAALALTYLRYWGISSISTCLGPFCSPPLSYRRIACSTGPGSSSGPKFR